MDTKTYWIGMDFITCIDCQKYKDEYKAAISHKNNIYNSELEYRRNLYWKRRRLNNCFKAKIETSSGTDGWGSTRAQPTMDNKMGH
tara:strand:+ start:321 stop:578 length:258 start_codon:yes stop_codon:yes gene_type:complete